MSWTTSPMSWTCSWPQRACLFMGDLAGDADLERLCLIWFMGDLANDAVVFIGDCSASIIT